MVHSSFSGDDVDDAVRVGEADWDSCLPIVPGICCNQSRNVNGLYSEQLALRMVVVYVISKGVTLARNFGNLGGVPMPITD